MPSLKTTIIALFAATSAAMPASVRLTPRQMQYHTLAKRQQENAAEAGLSDLDILQFALTLENLEETFYRQGFAKFPAEDFKKLGLDDQQISDLQQIGKTEADHVGLLQSSLAQAGVKPVQPCEYDFKFTDAAGMVKTAAVLENIGVSAYLGAAPLLSDKAILGTAGSILTVEARHQSSIRVFSKQVAVPQAFDSPLGPRAVFSLAAPFIKSCPEGSNLKIEAFPKLAMDVGGGAAPAEGAAGGGATPAEGATGEVAAPAEGAAGEAAAPVGGQEDGAGDEEEEDGDEEEEGDEAEEGALKARAAEAAAPAAASPGALSVGSNFRVTADGASGSEATNCAFTSGGVFPGGTAFSNFTQAEGCQVPQGVAGITYVTLTKAAPLSGALTDDIIVAGPMAVTIS